MVRVRSSAGSVGAVRCGAVRQKAGAVVLSSRLLVPTKNAHLIISAFFVGANKRELNIDSRL